MSAALRLIKAAMQPLTERLEASPLFLFSQGCNRPPRGYSPWGKIKEGGGKLATKASAKDKYVSSVTSPLAVDKMTDKLGTYLGISVSESAGPIANYKKFSGKAAEYFEKLYSNMQAAYR